MRALLGGEDDVEDGTDVAVWHIVSPPQPPQRAQIRRSLGAPAKGAQIILGAGYPALPRWAKAVSSREAGLTACILVLTIGGFGDGHHWSTFAAPPRRTSQRANWISPRRGKADGLRASPRPR